MIVALTRGTARKRRKKSGINLIPIVLEKNFIKVVGVDCGF